MCPSINQIDKNKVTKTYRPSTGTSTPKSSPTTTTPDSITLNQGLTCWEENITSIKCKPQGPKYPSHSSRQEEMTPTNTAPVVQQNRLCNNELYLTPKSLLKSPNHYTKYDTSAMSQLSVSKLQSKFSKKQARSRSCPPILASHKEHRVQFSNVTIHYYSSSSMDAEISYTNITYYVDDFEYIRRINNDDGPRRYSQTNEYPSDTSDSTDSGCEKRAPDLIYDNYSYYYN